MRSQLLLYIVNSGDDWYKANDGIVVKVDIDMVRRQQAYILLYEVEGMHAKHGYRNYNRYQLKRTRSNTIRKGMPRSNTSVSIILLL